MSKPKNPGVQRVRKHQKHREAVMRAANGICHLCGVGGADAPEEWTYNHPEMWIPGFGPNVDPLDPAVFVALAKKAKRRAVFYSILAAVFLTWFVAWTLLANYGETFGLLLFAILFGVLALKWNMRMWRNRDNAVLSSVALEDRCYECKSVEVVGQDQEDRYWCVLCMEGDLWLVLNTTGTP